MLTGFAKNDVGRALFEVCDVLDMRPKDVLELPAHELDYLMDCGYRRAEQRLTVNRLVEVINAWQSKS